VAFELIPIMPVLSQSPYPFIFEFYIKLYSVFVGHFAFVCK